MMILRSRVIGSDVTIIAGPYARQGYVDSTVREHSSVVKHISSMFDLPALGMRDAAAADLSAAPSSRRVSSTAFDRTACR